ncbi:MAG: alpha-glucosidase/alpha-galactosidase, partial [Clostridia bacterium]|nr:alpha-glucosidase/alpha-galactosidase [Clostridia bacterium]
FGLCHSVQVCVPHLLKKLEMEEKEEDLLFKIAGINHMAWLLEITDKNGNDIYPEIRRRAKKMNATQKHSDMVRFDYIDKFGYYCTESSEHNAEYNAFYIKPNRPDLIEKFNIPLDEYPRRCIRHIEKWAQQREELLRDASSIEFKRSKEYASHIMEAIVTDTPYKIGGNVINNGLIPNLPAKACVEVPCLVDKNGITPTYVGELPLQLAAMNSSNIYSQMLTIEAAHTGKVETLYQAALMEPHTAAELSTDEIVSLCNDLIEAHTNAGYPIF